MSTGTWKKLNVLALIYLPTDLILLEQVNASQCVRKSVNTTVDM